MFNKSGVIEILSYIVYIWELVRSIIGIVIIVWKYNNRGVNRGYLWKFWGGSD